MGETGEVSRLLRQWAGGDPKAEQLLVPLVYDVLHRLAAHHLAHEQREITLQPTALVHEAYLRLVDQTQPEWNDRQHFFRVAARLMRQILVDFARKRRAIKRGAGVIGMDLENAADLAPQGRGADVTALNDALDALEKIDARKVAIMELRYFGGFTDEETGRTLGISVATVRRQARLAEAWLHAEMTATRVE
jgi:RNA polymerase sigma-70 factor, ECF subfamily